MNLERFALQLAKSLEPGERKCFISPYYNISKCSTPQSLIANDCIHNYYVEIDAQSVDADNINNVTFPNPNSNFSVNSASSIFIPESYIQERSMTTGKLFIPT